MNIFVLLLPSIALGVTGSSNEIRSVFGNPPLSTRAGQITQSVRSEVVNCDVKSENVGNCVAWGKCAGMKQALERETVYKSVQDAKCGPGKECCSLSQYNPDDSLGEECGVRLPSGLAKTFGEFPWMVAILRQVVSDGSLYYTYVGGGSIINPRVVLTVASVFSRQTDPEYVKSLWARAGDRALRSNSDYPPHQDRSVTHIMKHEKYALSTLENNIALIILEEPFVQAGNVQMVCLPLPTQVEPNGTNCFATSWDEQSLLLKKVEQPVVDRKLCNNYLRQMQSTIGYLYDTLMCAGGLADTDDCQVDKGSPLVCSVIGDPNKFIQFGMLGRSLECNGTTPSLYTALTTLRQWIDETLLTFNINSMAYSYSFH